MTVDQMLAECRSTLRYLANEGGHGFDCDALHYYIGQLESVAAMLDGTHDELNGLLALRR